MTSLQRATSVTAALVVIFAAAWGAAAQDASVRVPDGIDKLAADVRDKLKAGIAPLRDEANDLDQFEAPEHEPHFDRPHAAVADWGEDMVIPCLVAMTEDFTDSKQRDIYIYWHLMWVVQTQSPDEGREAITQLIERIYRAMPGEIEVPYQQEWRAEPDNLYRQWRRIRDEELRIVVGYPPFQRYIDPPESLQYMEPGRREIAERYWQQMQALRERFEFIRIPEARAFNDRVAELNYVIRLFRGELTYELLRSGDPQVLDLIMDAIDRQARAGTNAGFDILNYMYIAANDGYLRRYDIERLQRFARRLERTARATEDVWVRQEHGRRNFAQYAYHMIETLKAGEKFDFGQPLGRQARDR